MKKELSSQLTGREIDACARAPTLSIRTAGVRLFMPHSPSGMGWRRSPE
jgi:hypothetical protein